MSDDQMEDYAAQRKIQEIAAREEESLDAIVVGEWEDLLKKKSGRLLVFMLLEQTPLLASMKGLDDKTLRESVGAREVGLHILDRILQSYPDAYTLMQQEARERELALNNVIDRELRQLEET